MPTETSPPAYAALAARAVASGGGAPVHAALDALALPASPSGAIASAGAGELTSFVGMVQDVWDPELYVLRDQAGRSALLAEDVVGDGDAGAAAPQPVLGERLPVYLVAPPGLCGWAAERLDQTAVAAGVAGGRGVNKRGREDGEDGEGRMEDGNGERPSAPKKPAEGGKGQGGEAAAAAAAADRGGDGPSRQMGRHPGMGLNTPLHSQAAVPAVIAKFYDVGKAGALKVHSLVRVTGVFCPAASGVGIQDGFGGDGDGFFADEVAARNPAGVPRLHVLRVQHIDGGLGLCPELLGQGVQVAAARNELAGGAVEGVRAEMVAYLASALGGDSLAAEYLLLNLVSRPVERTEAGMVAGKLSVNIVLPAGGLGDADDIVGALRQIMPAVAHVRVNIPTLNAVDLYPKKDYGPNRLRASKLQLPAGCALVADETGLVNGRLEERGVKNVQALTTLAGKAVLPVDFQFYSAELLCDASALFVSRQGKSIIPVDAVVRVAADAAPAGAAPRAWSAAPPEALRRMRLAAAALGDRGGFCIPARVAARVEDAFVAARREGRVAGPDGQEALSRWLAVARTCARSFGESELTEERWRYAVALERKREERNAGVAKAGRGAAAAAAPAGETPGKHAVPLATNE